MTNEESQMFEDEPALIRCLPELNSLRMTGKLTDLTIELQDFVKLYAHKVVFASRVPSLCNTLCETLTKNQAVVLKWPTISSEVATTLMDYIYTGRLEVHEANAARLIALSQQLLLPQVETWAVSFIAARLNSENILKNWDLAQVLKSDALRNVCLQHIKATFEVSVASSVFPQLPPDAVLSLLRADDLQVENEESLLNAIGRWIHPFGNVDVKRMVHAAAMMRELRWNQVDADFRYRLHDDYEGFWNKDVECLRLLGLINKWIDKPTSRGSRPCPFNERRRERLVDSEHRRNPLANICLLSTSATEGQCLLTLYDVEKKTSQQLTDVTAGLDAAFVVVEDCIFAIGGYQQHSNYTNFDKFDTKARRWNELVPLPECRKKPTAVAVVVGEETVIFVCGGSNSSDRELGTCMLYSPLEDKWYKLPYLKKARRRAAAVALPDGRVFVLGGEGSELTWNNNIRWNCLSEVEVCHLQEPADWQQQEQGQRNASYVFWKDAAPMLEPRKGLAAAAFRDSIFIAGGSNRQGYLSTVDVFTLPDNQRPLGEWTRLDTWDTKRPTTGLVVCADKLFSFGQKKRSHSTVLEFVLPASPSTPSRGRFDLWTWVDRGKVEGLNDIKGALLLS